LEVIETLRNRLSLSEFNNVALKCVSNWSQDRNSLEFSRQIIFLKPELNTKLFTYAYQFAFSNTKMIMTKMVLYSRYLKNQLLFMNLIYWFFKLIFTGF